jgi:4-oxalmesaconate hydratase
VIIDCHGHYTTTPPAHQAFRDAQLAGDSPPRSAITDDEIRKSIEDNQLPLLRDRGGEVMLFSPRASAMEHHVPEPTIARDWAQASNDLVYRVTELFPTQFAGVCQLPQTPGSDLGDCVRELRRCVVELGFVGCNLNPDPSGGYWTTRPLTDRYWFPLYEAMIELDVPAMIHVSSSCNPSVHTLGAHYLNADTTAFMQLVEGDLFTEFPDLRFVIPHGGGAVPYHWGRFRGLADRLGRPSLRDHVMGNVFFDTCVYHQAGIDLLLRVVDSDNILFASELLGAVRGIDPDTGVAWDDTARYIQAASVSDVDKEKIFERNVRRVYPRLDTRLRAGRA